MKMYVLEYLGPVQKQKESKYLFVSYEWWVSVLYVKFKSDSLLHFI